MKRIVILGAGFGGLRAAIQVSRKLKRRGLLGKYQVVLVDRNSYHTYTPLLYEVATTSAETASLADLRAVAAYSLPNMLRNINFMHGEVSAIDLPGGTVNISGQKLEWNYLVIALGSEPNFFNIPGLKEYAVPFKTFVDSMHVRDTVWQMAESGKTNIRVVIGGGGPTGIELAGELKAWCGELEREFQRCNLKITIVEGKATVLNGFSPKMIRKTELRLRRLGIVLATGHMIKSVDKKMVQLDNGETLAYDVLIWAGGVKAPEILAKLPIQIERNQIKVEECMACLPADLSAKGLPAAEALAQAGLAQTPDLSAKGGPLPDRPASPQRERGEQAGTAGGKLHSHVYAIGDNVCFHHPKTGAPISGVARAAISQANVAAKNIVSDILAAERGGKAKHTNYYPLNYPYILPIGGKFAIAKFGPVILSGLVGWVLKGLVELNYLISIMPLGRALKTWLKGLYIFIQNDRLG